MTIALLIIRAPAPKMNGNTLLLLVAIPVMILAYMICRGTLGNGLQAAGVKIIKRQRHPVLSVQIKPTVELDEAEAGITVLRVFVRPIAVQEVNLSEVIYTGSE